MPKFLLILAACGLAGFGSAQAQSLSIVSGNGQLVQTNGRTSAPLVVVARDAAGQPVAKARIAWTISYGGGFLRDAESETASDGRASVYFQAYSSLGSQRIQTSRIQAALSSGGGVEFTATTVVSAQIEVLSPASDQVLTGQTGTIGTSPIRVLLLTGSTPIPNVSVRLVPPEPPGVWSGPKIACEGGAVMTGEDGIAQCRPVFSGKKGQSTFTIDVGGGARSSDRRFVVTPGAPAVIRPLSGNNQTTVAGSRFPGNFLARVEDVGENDLPGVAVKAQIVPENLGVFTRPPTGTASAEVVSEEDGRVTLAIRVDAPGRGQVRLSAAGGAISAVFDFTVLPPSGDVPAAGSLVIVSGNAQTAPAGSAFAAPLVVRVLAADGSPQANAAVTFAVVAGSASLSTSAVVTDTNGLASVVATAGAVPGAITIAASYGSLSLQFSLSVAAPGPGITRVQSHPFYAAGNAQAGELAPGTVATILGSGLAPGLRGSAVPPLLGPMPYQLAGLSVRFSGVPAPLYNVSNINGVETATVQVPFELEPGAVEMTVRLEAASGAGETTVPVMIKPAVPALFETLLSDGQLSAVAVRPDGSYVSLANPAHPGERITLFATGLGQTNPAAQTNRPGAGQDAAATIIVGVDGAGAGVVSVRYAPYLVGVYALEIELPANLRTGNDIQVILLAASGDNRLFSNASRLPVQ